MLTVKDVLHTQWLLMQETSTKPALPIEVVNYILDLAEYGATVKVETSKQVTGGDLNLSYVTITVPPCRKVLSIEVEAEAHDQGWSSYPQDANTYRNSWTFGELVNTKRSEDTPITVFRNLHANSNFQTHRHVLHSTGANSDFIRQLHPGDKVTLKLRAMFPGWCMYCRRGALKLTYAL
eukprot:Colp12_sorted_trinity150504_noHs@24350